MFNIFKKKQPENDNTAEKEVKTEKNEQQTGKNEQKPAGSMDGSEFVRKYMELYAPYTLKDFVIKERPFEELPDIDQYHNGLRAMAHHVDTKRAEDPMFGARIAAQEILNNIMNWLKDDKGVHSETLLAVLASVGGRVCVQGVVNTFTSMISDNAQDRKKMTYALATILKILIAETPDGEAYIMGDRIGNEFLLFFRNAMGEAVDPQQLMPVASLTAQLCGNEKFWNTPYDELIKNSPKNIADLFTEKFEVTFMTYCRFPQERMLAVAFAAQNAVKQIVSQNILDKEKAASIIAEYGWRTSHHWGKMF